MLLYIYREEGRPFDFTVRRKVATPENPSPAYECCDVLENGISYKAGLRDHDVVTGFTEYEVSGHERANEWDGNTLTMLNARAARTVFILRLVKGLTDLKDDGNYSFIKMRHDYISTTKWKLKKKKEDKKKDGKEKNSKKREYTIHDLPMLVRRWDMMHSVPDEDSSGMCVKRNSNPAEAPAPKRRKANENSLLHLASPETSAMADTNVCSEALVILAMRAPVMGWAGTHESPIITELSEPESESSDPSELQETRALALSEPEGNVAVVEEVALESGEEAVQGGPKNSVDAANDFLGEVLSAAEENRCIDFACWETRLLELLCRQPDADVQKYLNETVMRLIAAKPSRAVRDECQCWLTIVLQCLPPTGTGGFVKNGLVPGSNYQEAVRTLKRDQPAASVKTKNRRVQLETWKGIISSIRTALTLFESFVHEYQQQLDVWNSWLEESKQALHSRGADLAAKVDLSSDVLSSRGARVDDLTQSLADTTHELARETSKFEGEIRAEHTKFAQAKDFAACVRVRQEHRRRLHRDTAIAALHEGLPQTLGDLHAARSDSQSSHRMAEFWKSLQGLFNAVESCHNELVKDVTAALEPSTQGFQEFVHAELSWMGVALVRSLERYFDVSFQVQEHAEASLKRVQQEQDEHDAVFGGYVKFDSSLTDKYEQVKAQAKMENEEMVDQQLRVWGGLKAHFLPDMQQHFTFGALDEQLSASHGKLWNDIKEPLQEAIDATKTPKATGVCSLM